MRKIGTACALLTLLLLAGCSGGKEEDAAATAGGPPGDVPTASSAAADARERVPPALKPLRKEFVIMRELVRQHELQQGNDKRIEAVEKALEEKFPSLPDKGETDEERQIYRAAETLVESLRK